LRSRKSIDEAAEDFQTKILKAETADPRVTGRVTKEYVDYLDKVEARGVSKAYNDILEANEGKSIKIGDFYSDIKEMAQHYDYGEGRAVHAMYRYLRRRLKTDLGKPGKPLSNKQLDEMENPMMEMSAKELDNMEKSLSAKINKASDKMGEGTPKYMLKEMRTRLQEGVLDGHKSDLLKPARDVARRSFKDRGIVVGSGQSRRKVSVSEYVHGASDEQVVKKVLIDGDIAMVEKAKQIFLSGSRFGKRWPVTGDKLKQQGQKAWNNMRASLFGEALKHSSKMESGQPVFKPDMFYDFMYKKVGQDKIDTVFSEGEREIIAELSKMDNRGLFDAVKQVIGGPRLTVKKKAIREGLQMLMKKLYKGKETTEFADAVAKEIGQKGFRKHAGTAVKSFPYGAGGGLIGRSDDPRRRSRWEQIQNLFTAQHIGGARQ